ncbi:MAG: hypothetical protein CFH07_02092, partial [Alphaproteobacteria bacterium MarineAlpha3_Bin6]
ECVTELIWLRGEKIGRATRNGNLRMKTWRILGSDTEGIEDDQPR